MNEKLHEELRDKAELSMFSGENRLMTVDNQQPGALECRKCAKTTEKLFQNNTCKSCLVESFSRIKKVIDVYRRGYGESVNGKSERNN